MVAEHPANSAAREAFEEAGILGEVGRRSVGSFRYKKRLKKGRVAVCNVHVFPLNVARQRPQWPEKNQRDIKWVSVKEAAEAVQNARLSEIILRWAQIAAAPKRRARRLRHSPSDASIQEIDLVRAAVKERYWTIPRAQTLQFSSFFLISSNDGLKSRS